MEARPPTIGRLIVIEPWVPIEQSERMFAAIGPHEGYEPTWIFEVSEPFGWKGSLTNRVLLSPLIGSWTDVINGHVLANGCLLFDYDEAEYCGLIAQVEASQPIAP